MPEVAIPLCFTLSDSPLLQIMPHTKYVGLKFEETKNWKAGVRVGKEHLCKDREE
jgi:hypothetical protein